MKTGSNQSTLYYLYMYKLVKSNGEATEIKLYHRENALEEFLKLLFQQEERIREELRKVLYTNRFKWFGDRCCSR